MVRAYRSEVREHRAADTRVGILATTHRLLATAPVSALTIPLVAREAGVSIPTVYRHFPTLDDLLREFFTWFRPRVGMTRERLLASSAETILGMPEENFPRFEEHGSVMRALCDSPEANRVREGAMNDRKQRAAKLFTAKGWKPRDLEAAVGAIYALQTPQTWRWLRDTWGLDAADAEAAATWGMRVLSEALTRPMKRKKRRKS